MLLNGRLLRLVDKNQKAIRQLRCAFASSTNNESNTASTSTNNIGNEKINSQKEVHRVPRLPFGKSKPFLSLIHEVNRSAIRLKSLNLDQLSRRLPRQSDKDWCQLLAGLGQPGGHFPKDHPGVMEQTKDFACDWMNRNIEKTTPVDFHNFLRFLGHYFIAFKEPLSPSLRTLLTKWFKGHYETLVPDAFFEIFQSLTSLSITTESQEPFFRLEDILIFINRAVELADDADVIDILRLLSNIDHYSALYKSEDCGEFDSAASRLIEVLRNRKAPNDLFDLGRSIMWLAKCEWATIDYSNSNDTPLRHPVGVDFDPAWKWLRYAIELTFDDADLDHRKGPAALVAVRAYQTKAIDFSAAEINGFLQTASAPYLADPSLPFKHQFYTSPHVAFIRLLVAIRTAANTDDLAEKLGVRFDDAFWRSFIESHEADRPSNLKSNVNAQKLIRDLSCVTSKLTPREAALLSARSNNLDSNQRALIAPKYRRLNIFQRALSR